MSEPSMPHSGRSDSDVMILSVIAVLLLLILVGGGGFMVWRWRTVETARRMALAEEMMARDEAEQAQREAELAKNREEAVNRRKGDPRVADLLRAGRPRPATPALDKGLKLCNDGQVGEGLLWFVRGLEDSGDDAALQRTFRINIAAWAQTPPEPRLLPALKQPVTALALSPDGKTVLAGCEDGSLHDLALDGGKPVRELPHAVGRVTAIGFGGQGKECFVANGGQVRRLDATTGQPIGEPIDSPGPVLAMALKTDAPMMMLGTCEQGLWLAEGGRRQGVKKPFHAESPVLCAALASDAKIIVTGHEDHTVQVHDGSGVLRGKPLLHDAPVRAVALTADGRSLAAAAGGSVRLWDVVTHAPIGRPVARQTDVLSLAFSPDGRQLLLGERSGTIEIGKVPLPQGGAVRRLRLWAQRLAGKELDAAGTLHPLNEAALRERRQQLQLLGGPPLP